TRVAPARSRLPDTLARTVSQPRPLRSRRHLAWRCARTTARAATWSLARGGRRAQRPERRAMARASTASSRLRSPRRAPRLDRSTEEARTRGPPPAPVQPAALVLYIPGHLGLANVAALWKAFLKDLANRGASRRRTRASAKSEATGTKQRPA